MSDATRVEAGRFLGDRRRRCDVGLLGKNYVIWAACPTCRFERWVCYQTPDILCKTCAREARAPLAHVTQEQFEQLYHTEHLTQRQIADRLGADQASVAWRMKQLGIKGREHSDPVRLESLRNHFSGPKSRQWKGGRSKTGQGYTLVYAPDHPRVKARKPGSNAYMREHILVWEQATGQLLPDDWEVHHLNGIKTDNRIENLEAMPGHEHRRVIASFQKRIRDLETEIRRLKDE